MRRMVMLVIAVCWQCSLQAASTPVTLKGEITISGAWALYPLCVSWAAAFQKHYPGVRINISAGGAGKGIADVLAGIVDLGMVSRDLSDTERSRGAREILVARDAVVAVINARHPQRRQLCSTGVSPASLARVWRTRGQTGWSDLCAGGPERPVTVFTRSDACGAAQIWGGFLHATQEELGGVGVFGDPGMADAVARDIWAIGYNNLGFAYDARTGLPVTGLCILPIDLDSNGVIDSSEDFFGSRTSLTAAIAAGRYPAPPVRTLALVVRGTPRTPAMKKFLQWVLQEGQALVAPAGYVCLSELVLAQQRDALAAGEK